jgi:hypothetical protein
MNKFINDTSNDSDPEKDQQVILRKSKKRKKDNLFTSDRSKQENPTIHGAYSKSILLPWEDENELRLLHEALRTELQPVGPIEEEHVFDMVRNLWAKRRCAVAQGFAFEQDRFFEKLSTLPQNASFDELKKSLAKNGKARRREERQTREQMAYIVKQLHVLTRALNKTTRKGDLHKFLPVLEKYTEKLPDSMEALALLGSYIPSPELVIAEHFFDPENLERIARLEASYQTNVEKAWSRLISYREAKRLFAKTKPA